MKKYFITGLVILLPVALTLAIILFLFNLFTAPFLGMVKTLFERYHVFQGGTFLFTENQIQNFFAQLLILISLFFICVSLGYIARWFFFKVVLRTVEFTMKKIPLVSSIYNTCKDVIRSIFTSKTKSFKQVVLVRFPNPSTYSLGLITRENIPSLAHSSHHDVVAVFVPTTPNPTSGFLIMFKQSDILYLDMKVEDAFKYIISCGVIAAPFQVILKDPLSDSHPLIEEETNE